MRIMSGVGAAALSALAFSFSAPALADEAEILAHYDAYEAAMSQGRFDVADREAEAAWRAAEETWGGIEDTAVLAFNLVRVRLMADRRAEAVEPALRIAELARSGNAQSVTPVEVELFSTLAQFDAVNAGRGDIGKLEDALEPYAPNDYVSRRIALLGWGYVANGRAQQGQYYESFPASQQVMALAADDPTAPAALISAVAIIGARASYETDNFEAGLATAKRGIAAYPTQPAGQPIDTGLANLLVWEQALNGLYLAEERRPYTSSDPALDNPKWDDGRYATEAGCTVTWTEAPAPGFGASTMGAVFEYRLDADGNVTDIAMFGSQEHPYEDALREAKAEPPASQACQGPYVQVVGFLAPKERTSGTR